jgi:hypothetical protein
MSHKEGLLLDIVVTDKYCTVTYSTRIFSDLLLRNYYCEVKYCMWNSAIGAADGQKDVNNNAYNSGANASPYGMLGNDSTAETSSDYRIKGPLYTAPDPSSVGVVSLGGGNQVVLAMTSAHTFAAQTGVTEAGLLKCLGSAAVYLTNNNIQITRNTFGAVTVPAGGTFTGTYTFTGN